LVASTTSDSFIVLTLTVLDTIQTTITQTIIEGNSFVFNNQDLTAAGTYRDTLTGVNNCDSFIVLTLTVLDTFRTEIEQDICQGDSFNFNDQDLTEAGTYRDTLVASTSADSFIVLTLTVLDTFQTSISQSICQGDSFDFNGLSLTEAGIYRDTLTAINSCDSFIVLTINVLDTFQTTITQTIIEGNSFDFNDQDLTEAGTYRDTLTRVNNCDSFIVLTLTVLDTFRTEIEQDICQGDSFNFNDQDLTEAGTYRDTLVASTTSDSFIVLTLTVLDTIQTPITQTIIEGNSFDFNNQDLTAAGTYRDTLTRINNCDSFIVLTLTVLDTFHTEIEQDICQGDSFNFNDQDLTEAGTYRDTLVASTSADSFIVLTLTVLDTIQTPIAQTIIEGNSFDFNDQDLTEEGIYRDTLTRVNTCDSFIVLTLTVLDTFRTEIEQDICQGDSFNFNDQDLTEAGTYRDTLVASTTSDSFIVLTLTVLDTASTPLTQTIIEGNSFVFNNQDLTAAGTYRDTLTRINNCDSFIVLTLTVLDTFRTEIEQEICQGDSFNFNDQDLTEAGTYRDTLVASTTSDSFIVLTLTVLDTIQTTIAQTIIEGNSFDFNDQDLTEEGIYRDTLTRVNTCDSFIVLTLIVLDTFRTEIEQDICQGDSFNFNDQNLTEAGTYRDTLVASTSADSFIVLTLTVLDTFQKTITQDICQGDSFDFNGLSLTEAGIYRDTLTGINGCDSFIVLTINVLDTFQTQIEQTICQGDSFNFNGQNLTESGTFKDTLSSKVNGCDSFVVLTLNVVDTFLTQIEHTLDGSSFIFNGQTITKVGIYRDTLSTINGCDSFIILTVNVFDLALKKTSQDSFPYAYNDTITFDIAIYNQGSIAAKNILLSDYLPRGYEFIPTYNSDWFFDTETRIGTYTIAKKLLAGDSISIPLVVRIKPSFGVTAWKNIAEISAATDTLNNPVIDIDSHPDSMVDNDGEMNNDKIHNENGDEDDSDFHDIEVYDLALIKQIVPDQPTPIFVGDIITYQMLAVNQGNTSAYDISIVDYVPNKLIFNLEENLKIQTYNPNDWALSSQFPTYQIDSIKPADTVKIYIRLRINPTFFAGDILNFAEISFSAKESGGDLADDIDSNPDGDDDNDLGGEISTDSDDHISNDDDGIIDEDDHDPAIINVAAAFPRIINPCKCVGNGLFKDEIVIFSTLENETWGLTQNIGGFTNTEQLIPTETKVVPDGKEGAFYRYKLNIYHQNGIGYASKFYNGKIGFTVQNSCSEAFSCRVIIPPTDSTGTPPPPLPICTNIINISNTPAIDTLADCDGCEFRSEGAEDATLYRDTSARNNIHTICPQNQWQSLKVVFSHFDLAAGDTLFAYDGQDTLGNLLGKFSGAGVSQTGGWIAASCAPSINPSGCITFNFKTNGDNSKGTGWIAETTCLEDTTKLIAPNYLNTKLICEDRFRIMDINPATITTNCKVNQDSQFVRIYNSHGELCRDTLIAFDENFQDTFGIGQYLVEYKLKTDTVKSTKVSFTIQAPSLVCNDKVTIPLGSACSIQITPDDLLENPCDTITDTLYYHITLKGLDKNGKEVVLATGGGKGGHYPILDKNQFNSCGATIKAEIERRYYENTNLTFCNNGIKAISCETNLVVADKSTPIFITKMQVDTLVNCDIKLTPTGLGLTSPIAVDNCDSVEVIFSNATLLNHVDICDTNRVLVTWVATDLCGNQATQTQTIVIIRPSLADIVQTTDIKLSCTDNNGVAITTEVPHLKIGQLKNGVLIPSDTIPLSTTEYTCGYILQKEAIFLPNTDCGKKIFQYWSVLDWCNPNNGPQPIDTTLINFTDNTPPKFEVDASNSITINLDHFACTFDVEQIALPKAIDNCSEPEVQLNRVSQLKNGQLHTIPTSEWNTLKGDSFQLEWIAKDLCQEQLINDTAYQFLVLTDSTKPSVICTDKINLSIAQNEVLLHYRDIDAGSSDACGIHQYEVSRDALTWDSIVVFTCADIHQNNTVYLRVTDQAGNQNTCWTTVNVEDKIAPICSALPDMTGTCSERHLADFGQNTDSNNNGLMDESEWVDLTPSQIQFYNTNYGYPNCSDNVSCGALSIQQQYQLIENSCGQININRHYRAVDWQEQGNTSNWVEQKIAIQYQPDWKITLPADWTGNCNATIPASTVEITNGHCDALAYEVKEKTFTIVADACLKTIRTFTIINWCVYEAGAPAFIIPRIENQHGMVTDTQTIKANGFLNNQALATIGRLEYTQVLKLQDSSAPIITVHPVNDCITADNCQNEKVFSCSAMDCNVQSTDALKYQWTLYKNKEAIETGIGHTFTRTVTVNEQFDIKWEAADACGNVAQKTQFYYFVDCQKPAPYCLHGIAVDLMDNGQVDIWAKDLDVASKDNCTNLDKLKYKIWHPSYDEEAPTHIALIHALPERITFDCGYLGNQTVRLYLIDEANNWDYCETYINVQDNQQTCESSEITETDTAFVNGQVLSWKGSPVEAVTIEIAEQEQTTDIAGQFGFSIPKNGRYQITPTKDIDPLNGVSTFDLVLISKHILGLVTFSNPHQYIAADANKSGTVTAFDMVQLRRLILAIDQRLPNNSSWRFVNKAYEFSIGNPLQNDLQESVTLTDIPDNQQVDFTAIKIGDVNGNAATNSLFVAESRTNVPVFEINVLDQQLKAGQDYEVAFTSNQMAAIQGYQFSLDFGQLIVKKLQPGLATVNHFGLQAIQKGWLTTSWNGTSDLTSKEASTTTLFTMNFTAQKDGLLSEQLQLQSTPTIAEAYNQVAEIMDVQLNFITPLDDAFELYQNQPNPFDNKTVIGFYLATPSPVTLTLLDERGQLLKEIKIVKEAGYHSINLEDNGLPKGLIFYQLQTKFGTQTKKMLRIE